MSIINRVVKFVKGGALVTWDGHEKQYPVSHERVDSDGVVWKPRQGVGKRRPGYYTVNHPRSILVVGTRKQIREWMPDDVPSPHNDDRQNMIDQVNSHGSSNDMFS